MRTYTIGEVLNRLKDEFDDITISKIRFLESEGLISPDRTDSGYRKFTDPDIDRLRYVLRSQRDRYLPLKVIKDELERLDAGLPIDDRPAAPPEAVTGTEPGHPAAPVVGSSPDGTAPVAVPAAPASAPPARSVFDAGPTDVTLSLQELCDASGLEAQDIRSLADHGLIRGDTTFDGDDLQIARTAAQLLEIGLEPRHLRMYRQFADRELSLAEQLVSALLRQRNPEARATAQRRVDEIVEHGARLHRAVLARELRALLRS